MYSGVVTDFAHPASYSISNLIVSGNWQATLGARESMFSRICERARNSKCINFMSFNDVCVYVCDVVYIISVGSCNHVC